MERPLGFWNGPPLGLLEQSLRLYLERALAPLERPIGAPGTEPPALSGTREAPLERPIGAPGTEPPALSGTPSGHLEQSLRLYLERASALLELPKGAPGTEPPALSGTRFSALGTPEGLQSFRAVLSILAILGFEDDAWLQHIHCMPCTGRHHTAEVADTWVEHIASRLLESFA